MRDLDSSPFDHLKGTLVPLRDVMEKAQTSAHSDPICSLLRVRQFAEWMIREVGKRRGVLVYDRVGDVLKVLSDQHLIPRESAELLALVLKTGNRAVHDNRGNTQDALASIGRCYELCVWFLEDTGGVSLRDASWHQRMRSWIIKPYPHYINRRDEFIKYNVIAIGWQPIGDIATADRDNIAARLRDHYRERRHRWQRDLETILTFRDSMSINDLVVMVPLLQHGRQVVLGQIDGNYKFDHKLSKKKKMEGWAHQRHVRWLGRGIGVDRSELPDTVRSDIRRATLAETDDGALRAFARSKGWL